MQELIKKAVSTGEKVLHTGVGFVAITTEKLSESVKERMELFTDMSKESEEKGKDVVDGLVKNAEARKEEIEGRVSKITGTVSEKLDFLKNKDFEEILERIDSIEQKITTGSKKTVKRARKVATK